MMDVARDVVNIREWSGACEKEREGGEGTSAMFKTLKHLPVARVVKCFLVHKEYTCVRIVPQPARKASNSSRDSSFLFASSSKLTCGSDEGND